MAIDYSTYFGINKGISPNIALLHIFLGHFFDSPFKREDIEKIVKDCTENLETNSLIVCKEQDAKARQEIFENMKRWIQNYSFVSEQRGLQPLPFNMNLIYDVKKDRTYRLFYMLYPDERAWRNNFESDRDNLYKYLYEGKGGVYSSIATVLYDIIAADSIPGKEGAAVDSGKKETRLKTEKYSPQNKAVKITRNAKRIGERFHKDFANHITSPVFQEYDCFRRINSIMLLVNFYLTLYTIYRSDAGDVCILAKGAENVTTDEGILHTAAIGCFSYIREQVFELSEDFYRLGIIDALDETANGFVTMRVIEGEFEGKSVDAIHIDGPITWETMRKRVISPKRTDILDQIVINYLNLRGEPKDVPIQNLAKAFVDYSKKRASFVRKVSSIFSVQGQQARFVFPKGSTHKYYGISGELLQLLLKLCLSEKKADYLTLDAFLMWLEDTYGIYISSSDKLMALLKQRSLRVPSFNEFELNTKAFIRTLQSISAIQKTSDKSYVVHDSGKVGVFSW